MTTPNATPEFKTADSLEVAIRRYTDACELHARNGGISRAEWEEARSYAVDVVATMLLLNPERWDYALRMRAASKAQRAA